MRRALIGIAIASIVMSGCGTTPTDRGASGAGLGAAAGATLGAITGVGIVHSAVIGALAGGLTGAVTNNNQINLGKPIWKQHADSQATNTAPITNREPVISQIQRLLASEGLYRGAIDGVAGSGTRAAVRAYQKQHRLVIDGRASAELLNVMTGNKAS